MSKLNDLVGTATGAVEQQGAQSDDIKNTAPKAPSKEVDALTVRERELALKLQEAELKLKESELKLRTAQLQDAEETLADRELKRETKRLRFLTNGQSLNQTAEIEKKAQKRCNHKKGGNGLPGLVGGQGHD